MKKILLMISVSGMLALMALVGGCGGGGGDGAPAPTETNVSVTAANTTPYDASTAATPAVWFAVHPSATLSYIYNVAKFAAGDRLIFDAGTAIGLINTSGTDGVLDVVGSLNGKTATIHLTGIAAASDGAIFGGASFNTAFGAGALSPTDAATVIVNAANAAPGYDASTPPAAVKFLVHPTTTFTYIAANFAGGDKLVFDDGTAVGLINNSGTDGVIDVVGSKDGQAATVHLTGIAAASDGAISGVSTFNDVFGFGSLVLASGDVAVQRVEVSVGNAEPGFDASTAAIVFNVHPTTTFTYHITKFATGDYLIFDDGTAIGLINTSGADGVIEITGTLNQQAVTVHLMGIAPVSDAAIFGVNSFNDIFGLGSLQ